MKGNFKNITACPKLLDVQEWVAVNCELSLALFVTCHLGWRPFERQLHFSSLSTMAKVSVAIEGAAWINA